MPLGIHCHNDVGCAAANSLLAVQAGAAQVQGTLLGFGERCGNANLSSILPTLQLKQGYACIPPERIKRLTHYVRAVGEISNVVPDAGMPYVGSGAFTHKGGMHIDGVMKIPASFEHIDPDEVGNQRNVLISEVAGRAAVSQILGDASGKDSAETSQLVALIKEREYLGYQYENASASLHLLALRLEGRFQSFFEVLYSRTIGEQTVGESRSNGSSAIVDGIPGMVFHRYQDSYEDDTWYVEVYDAKASKAAGIRWLRERYGGERTVCFGDNRNDLAMFAGADESYAVSGAVPELKEAASGVLRHSDLAAVGRFIRRYAETGQPPAEELE